MVHPNKLRYSTKEEVSLVRRKKHFIGGNTQRIVSALHNFYSFYFILFIFLFFFCQLGKSEEKKINNIIGKEITSKVT